MANNNTFEFIGRLSIGKESEKFKPYTKQDGATGWTTTRLMFNCISGSNRHMLEIKGLYKTDGTGNILTFSKGSVDEKTHEKVKGTKLSIAWKDRFKQTEIDKVAEFKKCIIDLEKYGRRYKIENLVERCSKPNITEEEQEQINKELIELGIEEPVIALEESKKKRKEFISEADFSEYIHKLITSGKITDKLFRINGDIVYREYQGKFYKALVPTRIYLAEDEAQPISVGVMNVFFNKNSLDSLSLEKDKKYYINAFVKNYDNNRKEDIACPVQLVIDNSKSEDVKIAKFVNLMVKQFTVENDKWMELGVKVKLFNGSQKVEITEDMLTDFQKEMLMLDEITMEDIIKDMGGDAYGEKIEEIVVINVAKGYTKGRKETVYIDSDFVIPEIQLKDDKVDETLNESDELDFDDIPF